MVDRPTAFRRVRTPYCLLDIFSGADPSDALEPDPGAGRAPVPTGSCRLAHRPSRRPAIRSASTSAGVPKRCARRSLPPSSGPPAPPAACCCSACNFDPLYLATSIAYRADRRATHAPNNIRHCPPGCAPAAGRKGCRADSSMMLNMPNVRLFQARYWMNWCTRQLESAPAVGSRAGPTRRWLGPRILTSTSPTGRYDPASWSRRSTT